MLVKAKATFFRVLKVASYLLSFPLLLYVIYGDAKTLSGYGVTAASGMSAFKLIALCFLGVAALQVVIGFVLRKKDFFVRALTAAVAASAVVVIPVLGIEIGIKKDFDLLRTQYAEDGGYDFERYEKQLTDYIGLAASHDKALNGFMGKYNLSGTNGTTKGGNLDRTPTAAASDPKGIFLKGYADYGHYIFGEAVGGTYSMNGLYADGFIFGYNQAQYILNTYHNIRNTYAAMGLDADAALESALTALELDGSAWKEYQKTEEYLRANGDAPAVGEGEQKILIGDREYDVYRMFAGHYYLTPDEVKEMLNTLTGYIAGAPVTGDIVAIIEGLNGLIGLNLSDEILDILRNYRDLDYDAFMEILDNLAIDIGGQTLNEALILQYISDYSFYQSPTSYPKIFFIKNGALRDYAYAKYLGTKHGAFVGSVLIGDGVGAVTLDNTKGNAPMSEKELDKLFARIEAEQAYMSEYYPWLAVRSGLIKFGGLVPAGMILAYFFAAAEKKNFYRLIAKGGKA
jgi:hypothetical protein